MKVINQTESDMTLAHASMPRALTGAALLVLGGTLFFVSATSTPAMSVMSVLSFVCFGIGLFVLFTNAADVVDLDKSAGVVRHKENGFFGSRTIEYGISQAVRVELRNPPSMAAFTDHQFNASRSRQTRYLEAFLVLADGTRLQIDYEHEPIATGAAVQTLPESSIAGRVARFLNIPIEDHARP